MTKRQRDTTKKINSLPELSSDNDETATLLEQIISANTITSLEDKNFINEAASVEVIYTQQSDRNISRLRGNKDIDVEKYRLCLNNDQ